MINPSRTDTYYGLGAALEGMGDKKGAIAAYDKYVALEKAPDEAALRRRRQGGAGEDRIRRARRRCRRSTFRAPPPSTPARAASTSAASLARAGRGSAQGQQAAARRPSPYKRAIAADRGNLDLYNDLGNVYFALKQYGDAAARSRTPRSATRATRSAGTTWRTRCARATTRAKRPTPITSTSSSSPTIPIPITASARR